MRMYMGIAMGSLQRPMLKLPLFKISAPIKSVSVNDKGQLRYSFAIQEIGVDSTGLSFPAEALAKMSQAMKQMEGMKGWALVDTPRQSARCAPDTAPRRWTRTCSSSWRT